MKSSLIILIITLISFTLVAGNISIKGYVVDKQENTLKEVLVEYIRNATILDQDYTNDSGYFELTIPELTIDEPHLPQEFTLSQNYPNPFNPQTRIELYTPEPASFVIYNILGQEVNRLRLHRPGNYTLAWGGNNRYGNGVSAGVYLYVLKTNSGKTAIRKMVLLDGGGSSGISLNFQDYRKSNKTLRRLVTFARFTESDTIRFSHENITDVVIPFILTGDTNIVQVVNSGPVLIEDVPDTNIALGDTIVFNFDENFYNDNKTLFDLLEFTANDTGVYALQVTAIDSMDTSLTALSNEFNVTVYWLNTPPNLFLPDTITVLEDQELGNVLSLLDYSNDAEGDSLIFSVTEQEHPELVNIIAQDDSLTLDSLLANWYGTSAITVSVSDGEYTTTDATVVYVQPVNDAPEYLGGATNLTGEEDNNIITIPAQFFEDVDSELTITLEGLTHATQEAQGDSIVITPTLDWYGTTSGVKYVATDGEYNAESDTFSITFNPVNDAPTIDIPDQSIAEDTTLVTLLDLSSYSSDVEEDSFTYTIISQSNSVLVNLIINNDYLQLDSLQSNSSGLSVVGVRAFDGSLADTSYFSLAVEPRADITLKHVHFKTNEIIPNTDFTINSTDYTNVDEVTVQLSPGQATIDAFHDDYWSPYFWVSEENSDVNVSQKDRSSPSLLDIGIDDETFWIHSIHDTVDMVNIEYMIDSDVPQGLDRFDTDTLTVWVAPGYDIADSSTLAALEEVALSDYKDGIKYISNNSFNVGFQLYGEAPNTPYIKVRFIEGTPHPGSHNEIVNFETNVIEWAELRFDTDVYKSAIMTEILQNLHARTDSPPGWEWWDYDSTGMLIYDVKMHDLGVIAYSFNPGTDFYQQGSTTNSSNNNDEQYSPERTTTTPMPKFEGWKEE